MRVRYRRVLSPFKYILILLMIYCILFAVTYGALSAQLPDQGEAFRIAYSVGTGGDPVNFYTTMKHHPWSWRWLLIFHLLSWLVLPLIAAAAVDVAFRLADERRRKAEERMKNRFRYFAGHLGMPVDEIEQIFNQLSEAEEER